MAEGGKSELEGPEPEKSELEKRIEGVIGPPLTPDQRAALEEKLQAAKVKEPKEEEVPTWQKPRQVSPGTTLAPTGEGKKRK